MRPTRTRLACTLCAVLALPLPALAQDIGGITLGASVPEAMPQPAGSQVEPPFAYRLWQLDGGANLSATSDAETGTVHYLEMWRSGPDDTPPAPLEGLTYGTTTRAEIEARFGSEGMVFSDRGRAAPVGDSAAYFISYEIAGTDTVLSFVTIQPLTRASDETAGQSVLDSVIVAEGAYLDLIWGVNRGRLPGYAPIADPFEDG